VELSLGHAGILQLISDLSISSFENQAGGASLTRQKEAKMPLLVIYLFVWFLLGLLVGALASFVSDGGPPYGLA
jgi:hypothetical protein